MRYESLEQLLAPAFQAYGEIQKIHSRDSRWRELLTAQALFVHRAINCAELPDLADSVLREYRSACDSHAVNNRDPLLKVLNVITEMFRHRCVNHEAPYSGSTLRNMAFAAKSIQKLWLAGGGRLTEDSIAFFLATLRRKSIHKWAEEWTESERKAKSTAAVILIGGDGLARVESEPSKARPDANQNETPFAEAAFSGLDTLPLWNEIVKRDRVRPGVHIVELCVTLDGTIIEKPTFV